MMTCGCPNGALMSGLLVPPTQISKNTQQLRHHGRYSLQHHHARQQRAAPRCAPSDVDREPPPASTSDCDHGANPGLASLLPCLEVHTCDDAHTHTHVEDKGRMKRKWGRMGQPGKQPLPASSQVRLAPHKGFT
eukprot:311379-Chlamydomonas_euryale.AAC.4